MTRERAETIGLEALTFLAGQPDWLDRFLQTTGLEVHSIRERASEPEFLVAVLDFLLANEALVGEFCRAQGIEAREVHLAQLRLNG